MARKIVLRMMGEFVIIVDGQEGQNLVTKSRKGVALIQYLVMSGSKPVPKQRLLHSLWPEYKHANPESALKTLVSRVRKILEGECEGLGECIGSERGAYYFKCLPDMKVDVLQIMEIFENLPRQTDPVLKRAEYEKLLKIYSKDLYLTGDLQEGQGYAAALHTSYLSAVYDYIDMLKEREEYNTIAKVCSRAKAVDEFDERLSMELMQALVNVNKGSEALRQYGYVTDLQRRYMDADPSEEMQEFYLKMVHSSSKVRYNLDFVRNELLELGSRRGAYICDYEVFKEICNLQIYNLARLGTSIFLGVIMLYDEDDKNIDRAQMRASMNDLIEILRTHLRSGDIVTRFAPNVAALLLPTVNHTTGNMVLERIRLVFQEKYPNELVPFRYRLGELE